MSPEEHGYHDGWEDADKGRPRIWEWVGYAMRVDGEAFPEDPPDDEYVTGYSDGYQAGA